MNLTEDEIRNITLNAINELGDKATPDLVKKVVENAINKLDIPSTEKKLGDVKTSGRIILTSFGKNSPGIVAAITNSLAKMNCDLQDMSQKIMGEFFTLIMIIDITNSPNDFHEILNEMQKIQDELRIKIYTQHEDIFSAMHRV